MFASQASGNASRASNLFTRKVIYFILVMAALATSVSCINANATAVGRTQGSFDVGPDGSANYNIPLWTPPGPHGLQPSIGLSYNTLSGNGVLGVGWTLSGLSTIGICDFTYGLDGKNGVVQPATANIRYCLNGKRLRITSGAISSYGTSGSVYQTELADFSRITLMGIQNSMPTYFLVEGKDGLYYEYGNSADSRLLNRRGYAYEWRLNKVRDRDGNSYLITYTGTGTTFSAVVSSITWSPTTAAGTSYQYKMSFNYSLKANTPDQLTWFNIGTDFSNSNRLDSITVGYSATGTSYGTVRQYQLTYETSPTTSFSRLKQIQECAATTSDCLAPTTFTYQVGQLGTMTTPSGTVSASTTLLLNKYDVNGDGKSDLIYKSGTTWKVAFSTGTGFSAAVDTGISTSVTPLIDRFVASNKDGFLYPLNGTWTYVGYNGSSFVSTNTGVTGPSGAYLSTDNNGDGIADIAWVDPSTQNLMIRLNTITGSATVPSFGTATVALSSVGTAVFAPGVCAGTRHCDINGDGATDLAEVVTTCPPGGCGPGQGPQANYYDLLSNGTGGYTLSSPINVTNQTVTAYLGANFNNDKCIDRVMRTSTSTLYVSSCDASTGTAITIPSAPLFTMDWNGDGRTDMVVVNGSTLGVYLSTGNTTTPFSSLFNTTIPYSSSSSYFVFDVDGDGLDDIAVLNSSGSLSYYTHTNASGGFDPSGSVTQAPDLLVGIVDGFGNSIAPTYISTAHSNYTAGTGTQIPLLDELNPILAVGQVTYSDPNATYVQTYNYKGARFNAWRGDATQGSAGFAGFEQITKVDSRNGVVTQTSYQQLYPNVGQVKSVNIYQSNGTTPISLTANTPETLANETLDATQYNDRYFPRIASSTTQYYEVGGSKNGQLISTTATAYAYDNYGNATTVTQTKTDNDALSPTSPTANQSWTTTETKLFTPDTGGNWCLGVPTQTVVTKTTTVPGETSVSTTTNFTPDYVKCRIKQQVVAPGNPTYQVTTDYGFDDDAGNVQPDFGNLTSVTVTGIGMSARTTNMTWNATGQYAQSTTNPLGQITQVAYDLSKYVQTSQTDANNLVTSWQYDSFGRKSRETHPDATYTDYAYTLCSATPGICPSGADLVYWVQKIDRDTSGNAIHETRSVLNVDNLLRFVMDQNLDGSFVYKVHRGYDAYNRVVSEYVPGATTSTAYHLYTLDILNRVTQHTFYNANGTVFSSSTTLYQGRTTTFTDAQSKQTIRATDLNSLSRKTQDANNYAINFNYDAAGTLIKVTDSQSNQLFTANYDYGISAFQRQINDMDLGVRNYTYNALGEVSSYTDANAASFNMTYDALSRPLTRSVSGENTTRWTWGSVAANHEIGQLKSVCTDSTTGGTGTACSTPTYTENYLYDNVGRLSNEQIVSDATYNYDFAYVASTGMLDTLTYPTSTSSYRLKLQYGYQYGLLNKVFDANATSTVFWQANLMNAFGETTQETLGNGIITNRTFDPTTGWLQSVQAGVGGGSGVQNDAYLYDVVGNLTQRQNNALALTESFCYDSVYRLTKSSLSGDNTCTTNNNLTMTYDVMGNITSRKDINNSASWIYDPTHKHQLLQAGDTAHTYTYDANGNAATRNGQSITWNKYNYPTTINGSGENVTLYYDANLQRWKQVYVNGSTTETTIYAGGLLQKVTTGTTTDWRHTIMAGGQAVAIYSRQSTGTNTLRYMLEDYQGSVAKIADSSGSTFVSENFTAFGDRRNPATWSGAPTSTDLNNINAVAREGYTYQTALGGMALNHMNGRVEDAITGRFLSADPDVTDPTNTQNYNRYSYVLNNPMKYTDPTGFEQQSNVQCQKKDDDSQRGSDTTVQCTGGGGGDDDLEEVVVTGTRSSEPEDCNCSHSLLSIGLTLIPGGAAVECAMNGCGAGGWALAALDFIPAFKYVKLAVKAVKEVRAIAKAAKAEQKLAKELKVLTCCFVAGTLVETESGERPIEDIAVGDKVWSRDEVTGATELKPVTELIRRHDREIWVVIFEVTNETVKETRMAKFETTDDHPWRSATGGWLRTDELQVGNQVLRKEGVATVQFVEHTRRTAPTFNLEVADYHSYFVGEDEMWVHNACTYKVPGSRTQSGKDYVGRTVKDDPAMRSGNGRDGRFRQSEDKATDMGNASTLEQRVQEQKEINAAGGVENLDNKINSIAPEDWEKYGISPP